MIALSRLSVSGVGEVKSPIIDLRQCQVDMGHLTLLLI